MVLGNPGELAVTDDKHLVVSECLGNSVTILDRKGKKVKSFEDVEFCHPHGVAITQDNFVVVADNHKLQKISIDGKCVSDSSCNRFSYINWYINW